MDDCASGQRNFHWCWAASIQMVLNYYGIDILQEQIVARTYGTDGRGRVPDLGGTFQGILSNLNERGTDNQGRRYSIRSWLGWGAPVPAMLVRELAQRKPVIIAYSTGEKSGHVAVLEGALFEPSSHGPVIQSLIIRDPWPSSYNVANRGRMEYAARDLASRIHFYWYITPVWAHQQPGGVLPVRAPTGPKPSPAISSQGSPIYSLGAAGSLEP